MNEVIEISENAIPFLNEAEDASIAHYSGDNSLAIINGKSVHAPNHFTRLASLYSWTPGIRIREESYLLSRNEYLLLTFAFAHIKQCDNQFEPIVVPLTELCHLFGTSLAGSTDYKAWAKTITSLGLRGVFYVKNNSLLAVCPYFSICTLDIETQTITMKLNPTLAPYFLHLEKNKTIFNFGYIRQLSSANTMRLYTFCASMRGGDYSFICDIEHLKRLHGYEGETKFFLRDVLMPGLYEINQVTDLDVQVQYIYFGKTIKQVRFILKNKTAIEMKQKNISPSRERQHNVRLPQSEMRKTLLLPRNQSFDATKTVYITS